MERIFGFDIGTTSIGFAVIDHDPTERVGNILRLGVRIFPEARDPDGTPLNQQRRQKRMVRRQLRRRRARRKALNEALLQAGLLPAFGSAEWPRVMASDPYELRKRGVSGVLEAHEVGRAIYHLAQHRHFKGRELSESESTDDETSEEKEAKSGRDSTLKILKEENKTLGTWLSERGSHERKRGVHAHRNVVEDEFNKIWAEQSQHHPALQDEALRTRIHNTIFAQRPVFWRKHTLGECQFMPGELLCPKGSWLSQQKRMLEKLNNLAIAGGNSRPLDDEERAAILARLQTQGSMSWNGVRNALKGLYKARNESGAEKSLKFNLELGGEPKLLGNVVEAKLADIFDEGWETHPHKQAIRDALHSRLWSADYGEIGSQRVVIRSNSESKLRRKEAAKSFVVDFGVDVDQAAKLQALEFPAGWEPYSIAALNIFMPFLEQGVRFGALVHGPDWENWRRENFPNREQPTGEILDKLPSPAMKEERDRIAKIRNPTVIRTQNELRKVVNNLIDMFGKPDRIRVEVARDVGKSKREREEIKSGIRKNETKRKNAAKDLESNGIASPSRDDVEKWLLWKEGQERCPYTGDQIGFDALFREGRFEVEHIWPRSRSLDDSSRNKTLCRKDVNLEKGNRMPFEAFGHDEDRWSGINVRLAGMIATKGGAGMPLGKIKRIQATSMPDDFASRQLNDTRYASKQILAQLKRLWPDVGLEAPVKVEAVTGSVTAQLRKFWKLNNVLADDGEKTRADHRHHAIDALAVACTHSGMTQKLSRYWEDRDNARVQKPTLAQPWDSIRTDAEKTVDKIIVSHRVRKRVSGALHEEMPLGYVNEDIVKAGTTLGVYVKRMPVEKLGLETLKIGTPQEISRSAKFVVRDEVARNILLHHLSAAGVPPAKAYPPYPRVSINGPEIRSVRVLTTQQKKLMVPVANGFADPANNHHIAIFQLPNGKIDFEVVSLFEAAGRLSRHIPVVNRLRDDGATFVLSLAAGDAVEFLDGEKRKLKVVQSIWSSGVIVTLDHTDAEGISIWRPSASSLVKGGAKKVSVDPIGRIRKAND